MTFNTKRILVTGGAGYVGSVLVPRLLEVGYQVSVLDLMIYGEDTLPKDDQLQIVKGDLRNQALLREIIPGHDTVIHLACISNDPSFELNPTLGKSINLDAFRPLVEISRDNGINHFIYASSSSVYGVKSESDVHEDISLEPLTDYSTFKANCEDILLAYQAAGFDTTIVRPATVCGYAPRQRLDVIVNILANCAYHKGEITVFGGDQLRPNIHILDMVDCYTALLEAPRPTIRGRIYNCGAENHSVNEIACATREVVGNNVVIIHKPTSDQRSYHISSQRIKNELGFLPKRLVRDGIVDLVAAFKRNLLPNSLSDDKYFNVQRMQRLDLS